MGKSSFSSLFIKSLLGLMFFLSPLCLMAQEENVDVAPKSKHWKVGILAGYDQNYHIVDMNYMSDIKYDKYTTGMTYGFQFGYSPVKWFSLRLDAVMVQKNYHVDHVFQYYNLFYSLPSTTTNQYINVPLVAMLNVGRLVKLHLFGGGYGGYWLKSHRKGTTYSFSNERYYDYDVDVVFSDKRDNRLEYGFTWGAGVSSTIKDRLELGAEVRWYYSVTDIQKPYMTNLNPRYNTTFVIQGGIAFWL